MPEARSRKLGPAPPPGINWIPFCLGQAPRVFQDDDKVAEIFNQALMMLAREIFDPESNRRVLVDHAFMVAGGEITKAARNWLGNALDATKRSQILFMDRDDILNLYVVASLPLPDGALSPPPSASPWPPGDEPTVLSRAD